MWPWCKMNDEELEQIAGGSAADIPGLEAIGSYAAAGIGDAKGQYGLIECP